MGLSVHRSSGATGFKPEVRPETIQTIDAVTAFRCRRLCSWLKDFLEQLAVTRNKASLEQAFEVLAELHQEGRVTPLMVDALEACAGRDAVFWLAHGKLQAELEQTEGREQLRLMLACRRAAEGLRVQLVTTWRRTKGGIYVR